MHAAQTAVEDFHRKMGLTIGHTPELRDNELRAQLILKKAAELANSLTGESIYVEAFGDGYSQEARNRPDIVKALEDLGDLLYLVYGTGVVSGVDLDPIFDEIHQANMTKGGELDDFGRVTKGDSYIAPFIGRHVKEQLFPEGEVVTHDDLREEREAELAEARAKHKAQA